MPSPPRKSSGGDRGAGAERMPVVFLDDEDPLLAPASQEKPQNGRPKARDPKSSPRLASLDAYRGLVMIAMASSAFGFARIVADHGAHPDLAVTTADGTPASGPWATMWHTLAYQFEHVPWVGCSFWDLIQPSFMFIVGVAMPFSFAKREALGHGPVRRFAHVLARAIVLVLLGVFLSSNGSQYRQTNFTFVNVLSQIGLGYVFVYAMLNWRTSAQIIAAIGILLGYWFFFAQYEPTEYERNHVLAYLATHAPNKQTDEQHQADVGTFKENTLPGHWNKHTNAAAAFDRWALNELPRREEFVINDGGYQTLNFIPSMVTMLFGVMAGRRLLSPRRGKTLTLLIAGAACFLIAMTLDTSIWPQQFEGFDWSLCPTVKRIWTPTWTLFSAGWALWLLAIFYLVMDVCGLRFWAFPLKVVGMNSIAIYCMYQLMRPWIIRTLETHLSTFDLWQTTFGSANIYAPLWQSLAVLGVLWLICFWLYRRKIFIRI
jgi:predicted acyltransferase